MHTQHLFNHLQPLSPEAADRWIEAALAEAAALRQHDDRLYPLQNDPELLSAARQLHESWKQWADDAESLIDHLAPSPPNVRAYRINELHDALGRARAMLKLSPETILARQEQIARGNAFTIEEARRELHLGPRG